MQDVPYETLRERLLKDGQVLEYKSWNTPGVLEKQVLEKP